LACPTPVPGTDYAAHINASEDRGRIWVFFDVGYKLKVVSYDEALVKWYIPPVTVADPDATVAKAIVDDGNFYVVWTTPSGAGIYLPTSADGTNWSSTSNPIASWSGATNWDPVLTKERDTFRLFWAPDAGSIGQFIATSSSKNPTDSTSWSAPVKMTVSSYGGNSWWDFWPQPYSKEANQERKKEGDKGDSKEATYLFYTSERNSTGTDRTDGNIWMMPITVLSR
jgi:hypothetical protein